MIWRDPQGRIDGGRYSDDISHAVEDLDGNTIHFTCTRWYTFNRGDETTNQPDWEDEIEYTRFEYEMGEMDVEQPRIPEGYSVSDWCREKTEVGV